MLTAKENSILDKAEDAILRKLDECLASSEPLTDSGFETLLDGVRTLDRICRIKYSQIPIQKDLSGHPAPDHPADPMRQWLVETRTAAKMSQQAVADAAGISQSYYAGIETGVRGKPIAVPVAKAIANVFGFDWTKFYEDRTS